MKKIISASLVGLLLFVAHGSHAATATFEDLALAPESSGPGLTSDGTWFSGGIGFVADWNETFNCCLSGFKYYSNRTNTSLVSFPDDDIATPGTGAGGSNNYAVAFGNGARAEFSSPTALVGAQLTTTTITHDVILNGDPFADTPGYVFGDIDGNAPDFLRLTITGLDAVDTPTGVVEFFLADYRFANNALDYVVDDWAFVDLSSLGVVSALVFSFDGTVEGFGALSTPTYFALDNLQAVPVPGVVWLFAGLGAFVLRSRRG